MQLSDWIKEKYVTATDESWRDMTNLLPKLQKHQAFEAELKTNKDRLDVINQVGTCDLPSYWSFIIAYGKAMFFF